MAPRVASIGTTHPWNVAGVGLDIAIARTFEVEVFTVVAGVSAQDGGAVAALHAVPADVVRAQLEALPAGELRALRIGALVDARNVRIVAEFVRAYPEIPAIVDPVLRATGGGRLADDAAIAALRDDLATAPSVILTPNLAEAAALLDVPAITLEGLAAAAGALRERGCRAVVLKGGHLSGDPIDALATSDGVELLSCSRIAASRRGTGCALAMAMACELARGLSLREALDSARTFVKGRLASACKSDALP